MSRDFRSVNCPHDKTKPKQNSFKTVLKLFCFSFIFHRADSFSCDVARDCEPGGRSTASSPGVIVVIVIVVLIIVLAIVGAVVCYVLRRQGKRSHTHTHTHTHILYSASEYLSLWHTTAHDKANTSK